MKRLGLLASVAAALGSVALGHLYFQRLEAEISGGPKVAVLVAAQDLPVNAVLTEQNVAVRDIPQAYVETRQVRAPELKKVLGARVAGGLKANDALLWTDLARFSDQHRVLSGLVQNGMRAVAIDLRAGDFDGLLRPGDRVDVLFTQNAKDGAGTTSTLLQNVLVLSVGGNIARADQTAPPTPLRSSGSVTLSVSALQAQLVTQAKERGRLTLSLRNPDDITIVQGLPETTTKDVLADARDVERDRKAPPRQKEVIEHVR
jgi:pilus assembly protein CpaB